MCIDKGKNSHLLCVNFSMLIQHSCVYFCGFMFVLVLQSHFGRKRRKERKSGENEQNRIKLQFVEKKKKSKASHWRNGASNRVINNSFPILAENGLGNWKISFLTSLAIKGTSNLIPGGPKTHNRMKELKEKEFLQSKPP